MNRILIPLCLLMAILPCRAGWQALFNGTDLAGWSGDSRLWRVEDGVLIGETDDAGRKIDANSFLIWQGGEPADFELEFQARVTGGNNSGVQYRSRVVDAAKWVVGGYQMDQHPQASYLGMLYEEQGRGIACERGQRVKRGDTPEVAGPLEVPAGRLILQTVRSHDQFNTTIYGLDDRARGIQDGRRVVFVNPGDLADHGIADASYVDLVSEWTDGDRRAGVDDGGGIPFRACGCRECRGL